MSAWNNVFFFNGFCLVQSSVVDPKLFFFPDPDPTLTLISDLDSDPDSNPDPACL